MVLLMKNDTRTVTGFRNTAMVVFGMTMLAILLAGCTKEKKIQGIRIDPRVPLEETEHLVSPIDATEIKNYIHQPQNNRAEPANLPPQQALSSWTHVNGNSRHYGVHPQLDSSLNEVWNVRIGEGNSARSRINSEPLVAEGLVFVMDSNSQLTAHSLSGSLQWTRDLAVADADRQVMPGGLAYDNGMLFATTGSGFLYMLDAGTGNLLRQQEFASAVVHPPTASGGRVYVLTADGNGWAVSVANDRLLWKVTGGLSHAVLSGGISPAIAGQNVIMPLSSGQIVAVNARSGGIRWRANTGGTSSAEPRTLILGISGSPVFDGSRIYAATLAGRVVALNATNGSLVWGQNIGASDTLWIAGESVYLISDDGKLTRLDAGNGTVIWERQLPHHIQSNPRRRKGVYVNYGPIMAGGRLLVTSDSGSIWEYSPESGNLIATTSISGGAATPPVVSNGTLYVVSTSGVLHAYR